MDAAASRRLSSLAQHTAHQRVQGPACAAAAAAPGVTAAGASGVDAAAGEKPKPKLAIVCTVWYYLSSVGDLLSFCCTSPLPSVGVSIWMERGCQ